MFYNFIAAQSSERIDFGSTKNEEIRCFVPLDPLEIFLWELIFSNRLV